MIRGEFITADGLVLPNQFTEYGMQRVLYSAFQNIKSDWLMGLCARNPDSTVTFGSLQEPSSANGYAREPMPMNTIGWPKVGMINGESYVESRAVTFTPTPGFAFDKGVNRFFLTDGIAVISIGSALPGGIKPIDTPLVQRYRLYFS